MSRPDIAVVAALIRLLPRAFRERFGAEMLATYLDQRRRWPAAADFFPASDTSPSRFAD